VQAVVRELHGEKIDIISWTEDPQRFIAEALSPAEIDRVGISEDEGSAVVIVRNDQLSLAIGKKGQNVRLASRLTGWNLDILSETEYREEAFEGKDEELEAALLGHARAKAQGLTDAEALFSGLGEGEEGAPEGAVPTEGAAPAEGTEPTEGTATEAAAEEATEATPEGAGTEAESEAQPAATEAAAEEATAPEAEADEKADEKAGERAEPEAAAEAPEPAPKPAAEDEAKTSGSAEGGAGDEPGEKSAGTVDAAKA